MDELTVLKSRLNSYEQYRLWLLYELSVGNIFVSSFICSWFDITDVHISVTALAADYDSITTKTG